jgi:hypothetical protein
VEVGVYELVGLRKAVRHLKQLEVWVEKTATTQSFGIRLVQIQERGLGNQMLPSNFDG